MPSTYKTEHLKLNRWLGEDKPKRTDFNEDNERIDAAVAAHVGDDSAHITGQERAQWNKPFTAGSYMGDNQSGRIVDLGFKPSLLIVSADSAAPFAFDGGELELRGAIATLYGSSKGLRLTDEGFMVYNPSAVPPDNEVPRLNAQGDTYFYAAFR